MRFLTAAAVLIAALGSIVPTGRAQPPGFDERQLFKAGFITDMTFTSDHRMFMIQKVGLVHLYLPGEDYGYDDKTTVLDIEDKVCDENERGLGGIQLHPNFDVNNWIYTYYTTQNPDTGRCGESNDTGAINVLSRWTWDPTNNEIDPNSEVVLLQSPPALKAQHNSGKIEFGKDGYLYIAIGELGNNDHSQDLSNLAGAMLRITDTGDIPPDNPFANDPEGVRCHLTGSGDGKCQEIYAAGLRNPFRFAMDPNTEGNKVRFFVNDVGASAWEEISEGGDDFEDNSLFNYNLGIQNFGWPRREGPCRRGTDGDCDDYDGYIHPIHYWQHNGGGAATAAAFVPNGVWPEEYNNKFLYAEFVFGKMYVLDPDEGEDCAECNPAKSGKNPETFLNYQSIITMRFGPYVGGQTALYYSSSGNGGVMMQVVCDGCVAPGGAVTDGTEGVLNTSAAPTAAPTVYVPPSRPEGEGGYPGVPFPWSSDCPEGYDFCGVLEFCENESSMETGPSYGYRLPCPEGETCECKSVPGPLIRLVPGNVYKITLRNSGMETTNLHTHGLHIVGDGDGDDVVREVMGGGNCLDYTWDIKEDHPAGTNWYHAHFHGISERQVGGGAFGMLIVEENTLLDPVVPPWASNELLLQVSVAVYTDEMFANGRKNEVIDIAANQWYRLRVSLVSANALPHNFTFADQGTCEIYKVATDGIWRSAVPGPMSNIWELTGASRADFAIKCNTPDTLVPVFYRDDEPVANIWVGAEESNLYSMEEWTPNRPYSISDMSAETVPDTNKLAVALGFDYVNDEYWDPMVPIGTIAYDQVHEWTLQQTWFHPFHMHLYHMQIVTPGGCGAHEEGEFYDTISADGNCTVRFRTADIGQRCVLHCHVLFHEDSGSMSWVNVTGPNMPMNTVQSPEYACPAGTLPSVAPTVPTAPPTQAPSYPNNCVPGYLGVAYGQPPLLNDETFVNEEFGVYIIQQGDGNLVVYRGTPENRGEVVWASGAKLSGGFDFYTKVNSDSNLVTYVGTPQNPGEPLWATGVEATTTARAAKEYFLGIDCNSEVVSVYEGSWQNPQEAVSVWNSQPTSPPTAYPTMPPTTSPPSAAPTASPTVVVTTDPPTTDPPTTDPPTAAPVFISLTLGAYDSTSTAVTTSTSLSFLALLLVGLVQL